jgi:hypothetical protein
MNIFRIILSLGILAASITWMSLDFLKREFFTHEISWVWENKNPDAKAWEISTLIMTEIENDFKRHDIKVKRNSRIIHLRTEASQKEIITNIVRDVNLDIANFDEHNKKEYQKKHDDIQFNKSNIQSELDALEKLELGFNELLDRKSQPETEISIEGLHEKKEAAIEKKSPKSLPEEIEDKIKISQVIIKDTKTNDTDNLISELLDEENTKKLNSSGNKNIQNETAISFSIESSLKELQLSLDSMNGLLKNHQKNQGKLFEEKYNSIVTKIEKLQNQGQHILVKQRLLLKDELSNKLNSELNRIKNELKVIYEYQIASLDKNIQLQSNEIKSIQVNKIQLLNTYIKDRKEKVLTRKKYLEQAEESSPKYGKLMFTSRTSEPQITDIKHSYSRFMIGIFACLFINMIWEIASQRSNAKH